MPEKNHTEKRSIEPKAVVGRDELNLIEIPFALPNKKNKKPGTQDKITTIKRKWNEGGKERYYTVTGSAEYGLPTTYAAEVYIAALELTYQQEFRSRQVHATKQDFLEIMGWHDNGQYRNRLIRAFQELSGTKIYTNTFWDHKERTRSKSAERGFGLIDDFDFKDAEEHKRKIINGEKAQAESYFRWNEVLFQSFTAGYIRRLDTKTYFSLKRPIAKTLYRIAGKATYKNRKLEVDLMHFAFDRLLMSNNYRQPSKIIQKLMPSIEELQEKAAEFDITITKSTTTKSKYKLTIRNTNSTPDDPPDPQIPDPPPPPPAKLRGIKDLSEKEKAMAYQLQKLGILDTKTTSPVALLKHYGASAIHHILKTCDYLESHNKPLPPPGVIVKHIRDGKPLDAYYEMRNQNEAEDEKAFLIQHYKTLWATRKAEILNKTKEWANLPIEERIDFGKLEAMENSLRKMRRGNFSEDKRNDRIRTLTREVPSFEEKLDSEREIAKRELLYEAQSEGLSPNDLQLD